LGRRGPNRKTGLFSVSDSYRRFYEISEEGGKVQRERKENLDQIIRMLMMACQSDNERWKN
jgi:hypothetical protein